MSTKAADIVPANDPVGLATPASLTLYSVERVIFPHPLAPSASEILQADVSWQTQELPLIENPSYYDSMDEYEVSWFKVPLDGAQLSRLLQPAVYIWRHNVRLGVFSEGRYLGGTLQHEDPEKLSISWNHPILIDLPQNLTSKGISHVYIRIDAGPGGTVLAPIILGEKRSLQALFDNRYFLQVEASFWVFLLCCALAVLSLWLWSQRRQDKLYLEFSLLSALSAVTTSFFFLDYVPFDMRTWLTTQHAASAWTLWLVIRFATSALEMNWQRFNRGLGFALIVTTSSYLILPAFYLQPSAYIVSGFLTLVGLALGAKVIFDTLRKPDGTRVWFSIAFIGMFVLHVHDAHAVFFTSKDEHAEASNWMQLTAPMLAIAFFAHLIHRFTDALDASEALNRNLEARVAATKQELESSYQKNRAFELESHANEERQRIYRELHDDLGSKLISIVHTAEDTSQQSLARGALESLRESIYKASNPAQTLEQCINQINEEAELRITSAGKQYLSNLSYQHDSLGELEVDPNRAYNLKRIFREGVSNILQHASCQQASFNVKQKGDNIDIHLEDDGVGKITEINESGGLANIKFRAERMGATVQWLDLPKGSRLALTFNVKRTH